MTNSVKGTWALPMAAEVVLEEEPTNGLEGFIKWDKLEEALEREEFASRHAFKDHIRDLFGETAVEMTDTLYDSVLDGLFPEYREMYDALVFSTPKQKLTPDTVRDIRRRATGGERASRLAREYGVGHNTVSDLINYKTWRNVA